MTEQYLPTNINSPKMVRIEGESYQATLDDSVIAASSTIAPITITLPDARILPGTIISVKAESTAGGDITVAGLNGQLIDGSATQTLTADLDSLTLQSLGQYWSIISRVGDAGGSTLNRILRVPFTTTAEDFKAGGDGVVTYEGAELLIGGSALSPEIQAVPTEGLRIGIIGGVAYNNPTITAPRVGVFVPPSTLVGIGCRVYGVWYIDYTNSTLTPTGNGKTIGVAARQFGAPSGNQFSMTLYQGDGANIERYTRSSIQGASVTNQLTTAVPRLPGGISVLSGSFGKSWAGDTGIADDPTSILDPRTWGEGAAIQRAVPLSADPWTPYVAATGTGTVFDLACWNPTVPDGSGEYILATAFELWAVQPSLVT